MPYNQHGQSYYITVVFSPKNNIICRFLVYIIHWELKENFEKFLVLNLFLKSALVCCADTEFNNCVLLQKNVNKINTAVYVLSSKIQKGYTYRYCVHNHSDQ